MKQNIKLLIVEDNYINLELTKKTLDYLFDNLTIVEARNGEDAIDVFVEEQPDVILMDIQMPIMNGMESTIEIRKRQTYPVPIIALSAGNREENYDKCMAAGMNEFMEKPIDPDHIKNTIEAFLKE